MIFLENAIPTPMRMQELVQRLNRASNAYYNTSDTILSDAEYDKMLDELKDLEKELGIVMSTSPTHKVGFEVLSELSKVEHGISLLSLDKTKDVKQVSKFLKNKPFIAMHKLDGLTVKLEYNNGELQRASTRGNGSIGEDITHNAKKFINIPLSISFKGKMTIVGEAIAHINTFNELNEKLYQNKYKHPRNFVSGSVRQLDNEEIEQRQISFYAFNILETDMELSDSKMDRFGQLMQLGFSVVGVGMSTNSSEESLEYYISNLSNMANSLHFPIDGIVFSFDSVEYSEKLGKTSHHPLHSIAFKFKDEVAETTLKDIEWSVGKTQITPVAIFEEVEIDSTNVTRASLHNISIMRELELGVGDKIGVIKANMIIPQVTENYTRSNDVEIPSSCPACGGDTEILEENSTKVLVCTNERCFAKVLKKLGHFVSRDALNVDGLNEATLEKVMLKVDIETFSDVLKLSKLIEENQNVKNLLIKMDGFGKKSIEKIVTAINKCKTTTFDRLLYSLSIPLIGRSASKTIAKHYNNNVSDFIDDLTFNKYDFTNLDDFGDAMHESLTGWFSINENMHEFKELLKEVILKTDTPKAESNKLEGLNICCTGKFASYSRDDIKKMIESNGGKVASGVSGKTTHLVAGEKAGSKLKKANDLGVIVLSEDDFINMLK